MSKVLLTVSALAGCMALAAAAAPAQAFSGSKSSTKRAHKHHGFKHHGRYYEARYKFGARDDCAQYRLRARLTGSSYWAYAAKRCHVDRYYYD